MSEEASPSLCLDWGIFERNVTTIVSHLSSMGKRWRPHVKSHGSGQIAGYLIEHGATGVTVATLGQARTMSNAGIRSILLTTPLGRPSDWRELGDLQENGEVLGTIDSLDHLALIEAAAPSRRIPLVVEVDLGLQRTGTRSIEAAMELAEAISSSASTRFVGFMGYEGQVFRLWPEAVKQAGYLEAIDRLSAAVDEGRRIGLDVTIVTGGGTGSLFLDPDSVFDESQAGGGVFMDQTYRDDFHVPHLEPALFIDSTVVAVHPPYTVVIDAGFKMFGVSRNLPTPTKAGISVGAVSAHSSMIVGEVGDLRVGSSVRLLPGYSDATLHGSHQLLVDGRNGTILLHHAGPDWLEQKT